MKGFLHRIIFHLCRRLWYRWSMKSPRDQKWGLHSADPYSASSLGSHPASVPSSTPCLASPSWQSRQGVLAQTLMGPHISFSVTPVNICPSDYKWAVRLNNSPSDSSLCLQQDFRTPIQRYWQGHLDPRRASWSQTTQAGDILNRMVCLVAAAQDNGLAVGAEREPGCRRAVSPQVSTASGGRALWTPAAVWVFAAPAQPLHWQGWGISSASQTAQQSNGVLLDFPCWLIPEYPCSHPCCSSHHCPAAGRARARKVPPPAPLDNSHSSPQHYTSPQALAGPLWQPFHPLQCKVLWSCIAPALLSCFPIDNCAVDILGVVLLSLILAPELNRDGAACSSSCFLYRKADRQSN